MERRASRPIGQSEMTEFRAVSLLSASNQILEGQRNVKIKIRSEDSLADLSKLIEKSRKQVALFLATDECAALQPFSDDWESLTMNEYLTQIQLLHERLRPNIIKRFIRIRLSPILSHLTMPFTKKR